MPELDQPHDKCNALMNTINGYIIHQYQLRRQRDDSKHRPKGLAVSHS